MKNPEDGEESNRSQVLNLTSWNLTAPDEMRKTVQECAEKGIGPYSFQCGKITVDVEYEENGPRLAQVLKGILIREKAK